MNIDYEWGTGVLTQVPYDLSAGKPLDSRIAVNTIEERDMHLVNNRVYPGMQVYVVATNATYVLGSDGTTWVEMPTRAWVTEQLVEAGKVRDVTVDGTSVLDETTHKANIVLTGKVDKTRTIAGLDLSANITDVDLRTAINVQNGAEPNFIKSVDSTTPELIVSAEGVASVDLSAFAKRSEIAAAMTFKGAATGDEMPGKDVTRAGDTWYITTNGTTPETEIYKAGFLYASNGTAWVSLGASADLSNYVEKTRKVNGKALAADITVNGGDIPLTGYVYGSATGEITASDKINDAFSKVAYDNVFHHTDTGIHVTAANKTAWNAKYDKPSGGIPKMDMTTGVQASLDKADTALQASALTPYRTSADQDTLDLATKEYLTNKATSISATSTDTQYPSAKCVWDAIQGISPTPAGGTTGQVLAKKTDLDQDVEWKTVGSVPAGGSANTFLKKQSDADYDSVWVKPATSELTFDKLSSNRGLGQGLLSMSGTDQLIDTNTVVSEGQCGRFSITTYDSSSAISSMIGLVDGKMDSVSQSGGNPAIVYRTTTDTTNKYIMPQTIEQNTNKVTSIASTSTNTEYPSALAVYNYVNATLLDIEGDLY